MQVYLIYSTYMLSIYCDHSVITVYQKRYIKSTKAHKRELRVIIKDLCV